MRPPRVRLGLSLCVVAAALLAVTAATDGLDEEHALLADFKARFGADTTRFPVYVKNVRAAARKTQATKGEATFGPNKFSNLTESEFQQLLGTRIRSTLGGGEDCSGNTSSVRCSTPLPPAPVRFDWRSKPGIIEGVRNQGQCGGCWAFSAAELVSAMWRVAGNQPLDSSDQCSVQELISCVDKCAGCRGGYIDQALLWVLSAGTNGGGEASESAYPFACSKGCDAAPACAYSGGFPAGRYATITGTCTCGQVDENWLASYIATYGPVSIVVDSRQWHDYTSGIIRHHCSTLISEGDHAVQIVGFDVDAASNTPYWIVRNSWGSDWGEGGYVRIVRGQNACGLANAVSFAFSPSP